MTEEFKVLVVRPFPLWTDEPSFFVTYAGPRFIFVEESTPYSPEKNLAGEIYNKEGHFCIYVEAVDELQAISKFYKAAGETK